MQKRYANFSLKGDYSVNNSPSAVKKKQINSSADCNTKWYHYRYVISIDVVRIRSIWITISEYYSRVINWNSQKHQYLYIIFAKLIQQWVIWQKLLLWNMHQSNPLHSQKAAAIKINPRSITSNQHTQLYNRNLSCDLWDVQKRLYEMGCGRCNKVWSIPKGCRSAERWTKKGAIGHPTFTW